MTAKKNEKDKPVKNPIEWLFGACLMLLGCAIALSLALSLLSEIWPWIAAIGLVVGPAVIWLRASAVKRRDW